MALTIAVFLVSAIVMLPSGGMTVRIACGSTTSRSVAIWLRPRDRAASIWRGSTDRIPDRIASATYAPV